MSSFPDPRLLREMTEEEEAEWWKERREGYELLHKRFGHMSWFPTREEMFGGLDETEADSTHSPSPANVAAGDQGPDQLSSPTPTATATPTPPPTITIIPTAPSSPTPKVSLDFDPHKGKAGPEGVNFAPIGAVAKFCYKWTPKALTQAIATRFFDANKVWDREWDLFYLWTDSCPRPLIFITEAQLQAFLDDINLAFPKARLSITEQLRDEGLTINFDELPQHLRPRVLGHSTARVQHDHWSNVLALSTPTAENMPEHTLEAFKEKIAAAVEVQKNKSKAKSASKRKHVIDMRQGMTRQLLHCERILGLAKNDASTDAKVPFDSKKPAPFPFEQDVIIIAFDVEAHERMPRAITEVGIATLDTRKLKGAPPGADGEGWHDFIEARHFRTIEYKNHVNCEFVAGCPDRFEFGESEFVNLDRLPAAIAACFRAPFSTNQDGEGAAAPENQASVESRNIILLGHDIMSDISYLSSIGLEVEKLRGVVDKLDTTALYKAFTQDPDARSLGSVLASFEMVGWNLHNAGNDAVYTMWIMLATAVRHAREHGTWDQAKRLEELKAARAEAAAARAREKCFEDGNGWTVTEDANGWGVIKQGGATVAPKDGPDGAGGVVFEPKRMDIPEGFAVKNHAATDGVNSTAKTPFGPEPRPEDGLEGFQGYYTEAGAPLDV